VSLGLGLLLLAVLPLGCWAAALRVKFLVLQEAVWVLFLLLLIVPKALCLQQLLLLIVHQAILQPCFPRCPIVLRL
jgi:hypothetical protein